MAARNPMKRKMTAREAAAQFGVTERTVRNVAAQPRAEYLAERRALRAQIVQLREQGMPWQEVGHHVGLSAGAARLAGRRAGVRTRHYRRAAT